MSSLLSDKQRLRIKTRHRNSVEQFGYQPQALYWSSREIQEIRFKKLSELLPLNAKQENGRPSAWSILDVGCGFADLKEYLYQHGFEVDYYGIDLSEAVAESAQNLHPGIQIQVGDIFDVAPKADSYDFVLLSGALNEVVETEIEGTAQHQGRYAKAVIRKMYDTCRYGVAFNLLDARNPWIQSRPDLQSFLPQEIVEYCKSFAARVRWSDGYLENDFTVYLEKQ